MKLTEISSLWGNLYRHRYYIDGKRVSDDTFSYSTKDINLSETGKSKKTAYGYRKDWDI